MTRTWKPLTAPTQHVLSGYDGRVMRRCAGDWGMIYNEDMMRNDRINHMSNLLRLFAILPTED